MNYEEFNLLLKNTGLNKKDFSEKTGLAYSSIMNWSSNNNIPYWVKSWLENYLKAKKSEEVFEAIRPFIDCGDKSL